MILFNIQGTFMRLNGHRLTIKLTIYDCRNKIMIPRIEGGLRPTVVVYQQIDSLWVGPVATLPLSEVVL